MLLPPIAMSPLSGSMKPAIMRSKRGLAASGGTQNRKKAAALDREGERVDGGVVGKAFDHRVRGQIGLGTQGIARSSACTSGWGR